MFINMNNYNSRLHCLSNGSEIKSKRSRTAFSTKQLEGLEAEFRRCRYMDSKRRPHVAAVLDLTERTIKVWFQNRRMKEKKVNKESHCNSTVEDNNIRNPIDCYVNNGNMVPAAQPMAVAPNFANLPLRQPEPLNVNAIGDYYYTASNRNMNPAAQPFAMPPNIVNVPQRQPESPHCNGVGDYHTADNSHIDPAAQPLAMPPHIVSVPQRQPESAHCNGVGDYYTADNSHIDPAAQPLAMPPHIVSVPQRQPESPHCNGVGDYEYYTTNNSHMDPAAPPLAMSPTFVDVPQQPPEHANGSGVGYYVVNHMKIDHAEQHWQMHSVYDNGVHQIEPYQPAVPNEPASQNNELVEDAQTPEKQFEWLRRALDTCDGDSTLYL